MIDDPASFEIRSDLLRADGLQWSRPLYVLSMKTEGRMICIIVPDDLDRVLLTLPLSKA